MGLPPGPVAPATCCWVRCQLSALQWGSTGSECLKGRGSVVGVLGLDLPTSLSQLPGGPACRSMMQLGIPRVVLISNILCSTWRTGDLVLCGILILYSRHVTSVLSGNPEALQPCSSLLISIHKGSLSPPPIPSKWPRGAELQGRRATEGLGLGTWEKT